MPLLIQLDGESPERVRHQDLPAEPEKPEVPSAISEATVMLCSPAGFASGSGSDRFGSESANRQKYELDRL